MVLSEDAFRKGQYPKEMTADMFTEKTLEKEVWEQLTKDFSEEN